jgi:hypothetical protein
LHTALIFLKVTDLEIPPKKKNRLHKRSPNILPNKVYLYKLNSMSKNKKIIIGIFSILPFLLFVFYLVSMISFFIYFFRDVAVNGERPEDMIFSGMADMVGMIVTMVLLGLLSLGVMVYFIIHTINNQLITGEERLVWILVFIFVGMVSFPIYWYMRIWRGPELNTA